VQVVEIATESGYPISRWKKRLAMADDVDILRPPKRNLAANSPTENLMCDIVSHKPKGESNVVY
jgi:hypothetical protein